MISYRYLCFLCGTPSLRGGYFVSIIYNTHKFIINIFIIKDAELVKFIGRKTELSQLNAMHETPCRSDCANNKKICFKKHPFPDWMDLFQIIADYTAMKFFLIRISKQKACRNTGHIYRTLSVLPSCIQISALKRKKAAAQSKNSLCCCCALILNKNWEQPLIGKTASGTL